MPGRMLLYLENDFFILRVETKQNAILGQLEDIKVFLALRRNRVL